MFHEFFFITEWDWCFKAIITISFTFLSISLKFAQELSHLGKDRDIASILAIQRLFIELMWGLRRYIVQVKFEWLCVPMGECVVRNDTFEAHILQLHSITLRIKQFFIIFHVLWRLMHIVLHLYKSWKFWVLRRRDCLLTTKGRVVFSSSSATSSNVVTGQKLWLSHAF